MKQALDLGWTGLGVLAADALPGNVARQLVQLQSQSQALFTGHATVPLDLFFECHRRSHHPPIAQFTTYYNCDACFIISVQNERAPFTSMDITFAEKLWIRRLLVEPEVDQIVVLHDVRFGFQAQFAGSFGLRLATGLD